MKVAFRVDASSQIGTGHFMRCLTVAHALKQHCERILFVGRSLPRHLRTLLETSGYEYAHTDSPSATSYVGDLHHSAWLEISQEQDAKNTLAALGTDAWDWLVVDHYGIDVRWEAALRKKARRILVIDDLADRQHDCDALVDQNLYQDQDNRYQTLISADCRQFIGPRYAFLRDEFHAARQSLEPRSGKVKHLFIYFGGADPDNHTRRAIDALCQAGLDLAAVDVVIGAEHADRQNIEAVCLEQGFSCHVQTPHIAQLMAKADLAIGAGGISTFERLYLRLPAIVQPISFNQKEQLEHAAALGLVQLYKSAAELIKKLSDAVNSGVTPPADCVGGDNGIIGDYMVAQTRKDNA